MPAACRLFLLRTDRDKTAAEMLTQTKRSISKRRTMTEREEGDWKEELAQARSSTFSILTLFENYSKCRIWIFQFWHFPPIFGPIKTEQSGNTVWPQALGFQKLAKIAHFGHFKWTLVHSICKGCSLRSQCWMILFLWFSNNVLHGAYGLFKMMTKGLFLGKKRMERMKSWRQLILSWHWIQVEH